MWPLFSSTTTPSGMCPAWLTIVRKSDPSGLHDITRPSLRSKKNRRAILVWDTVFPTFELLAADLLVSALLIAHLLKLRLLERHDGSCRLYGIGQFPRCWIPVPSAVPPCALRCLPHDAL